MSSAFVQARVYSWHDDGVAIYDLGRDVSSVALVDMLIVEQISEGATELPLGDDSLCSIRL